MTINYTTLFTEIGSVAKTINYLNSFQGTTLLGSGGYAQQIITALAASPSVSDGTYSKFESFAGQAASFSQSIRGYADGVMATLQTALNATSTSPSTILPLLSAQMAVDSQTIQRNTATGPATGTAVSSNVGNGTMVIMSNSSYGFPDERIYNETVKLVCIRDQDSGASVGAENFSMAGAMANNNPYANGALGMGSYSGLQVIDSSGNNYLSSLNGTFDSFTSPTFASWSTPTLPVATYSVGYTITSSTGETTISPATTITTTAGQALAVTLPALPIGGTGMNIYLDNGSGVYRRQYTLLPAGVWPVGQLGYGVTSPATNTSGLTAPSAAPTASAYIPGAVGQDTNRVVPATGGGALVMSSSSTGPLYLTQNISSLTIPTLTPLILSAWLMQAHCTSGSNLVIGIVNSEPGFQTIFNGDPSTLTGAYQLKTLTWWLGNLSPNSQLMIIWQNSSTAGAGAQVLVDQMVFAKMYQVAYRNYALLRGTVDFVQGDTFSAAFTNNFAGVFQSFFGRYYGQSLHSVASSPTILDSLA